MFADSKTIARRFVEEGWNNRNLDAIDELVHEDYIDHDPGNPYRDEGREGLKKLISMYQDAFADSEWTIDDLFAEGDRVVMRWTARGTHRGELMGIPASGRQVTVTGINIDRTADGKIVEAWANWDMVGLLQQLGILPEIKVGV
ncbi:hypothetical protein LCGC14_2798740 [marine sediment metagenome]|uniref:Ester cyclase n=1 Tax=marine sediment metagenome TaxID=412755 RepID=A0A0F8YNH8_9ZZZZ